MLNLSSHSSCNSGFGEVLREVIIKGAEAILIAHIVSSCHSNIRNYGPYSMNFPFFHQLSPHHQLSLLTEVCVGLLHPTAPPPPDTLEHFSAFYAIYSYMDNKLEEEILEAEDAWCLLSCMHIFSGAGIVMTDQDFFLMKGCIDIADENILRIRPPRHYTYGATSTGAVQANEMYDGMNPADFPKIKMFMLKNLA